MRIKYMFRSRIFQFISLGVLTFGLGFGAALLFFRPQPELFTTSTLPLQLSAEEENGFKALADIQAAFQNIAQKANRSVVQINVLAIDEEPQTFFDFPFPFFFGPQGNNNLNPKRQNQRQGLGSGVIVRQSDNLVYVITNYHVISNADEIEITLADKQSFKAELIAKDQKKDLALLSFKTKEKVTVAVLGDSDTVAVGDWVIALGSPLGFSSSVTKGIISAVGRTATADSSIAPFTTYLQTDAPINQGNSGGALINIKGEVIGINTWIASPSGGSVGLGFAIPINTVKRAVEDFLTKGTVSYGWLGVAISDLKAEDRAALSLGESRGCFILGVYKNSPAAQAGILPGDYITAINGKAVEDTTSMLVLVGNLAPTSKATVSLKRLGKDMHITAQLSERPADSELSGQNLWPGFRVVTITPEIRKQLSLPAFSGNLVVAQVEKDSAAAVAGIKAGDVIKAINSLPVTNLAEFYQRLNDPGSKQVIFNLQRNNHQLSLGLVK